MTTVTLHNIPDELLERLRKSADRHSRTLDREALVCIERGLDEVQPDPAARLERIRESRNALAGVYVTDADLRAAQDEAAGLANEDSRQLTAGRKKLSEFFRESPLVGVNQNLDRDRDTLGNESQ